MIHLRGHLASKWKRGVIWKFPMPHHIDRIKSALGRRGRGGSGLDEVVSKMLEALTSGTSLPAISSREAAYLPFPPTHNTPTRIHHHHSAFLSPCIVESQRAGREAECQAKVSGVYSGVALSARYLADGQLSQQPSHTCGLKRKEESNMM